MRRSLPGTDAGGGPALRSTGPRTARVVERPRARDDAHGARTPGRATRPARTIGSWFGTGSDRGIALVFVLTGVIGLIVTALALRTRFYAQLSERYGSAFEPDAQATESSEALPCR